MVKASGQIEQTLNQLQDKTADIAEEFEALYQSYLKSLSEAVQHKLVLAAYHLCTQIYPESFLTLTGSQRSKLQHLLQQLGAQMYDQLMAKWSETKTLSRKPPKSDGMSIIKQLFLRLESEAEGISEEDEDDLNEVLEELVDESSDQGSIQSKLLSSSLLLEDASDKSADDSENLDQDMADLSLEDTDEDASSLLDDDDLIANLSDEELESLHLGGMTREELDDLVGHSLSGKASSETSSTLSEEEELHMVTAEPRLDITAQDVQKAQEELEAEDDDPPGPLEPIHLMRQQLLMEKAIRDVLKAISETANYILQQSEVVPELPKPLLAAAAESDGLAQMPMKTPNLLKISVKIFHGSSSGDSENGKKRRRKPKVLQLDSMPECVVIHLRLSEIEFAETKVSLWRSRIREKTAKLKQLGNAYQKAQRELAIANAEEAWRATWVKE